MATLKLSSPWVIYYKELCALFGKDEHVHIVFDEGSNTVKLYVEDEERAAAIESLLPVEKHFGEVTLYINVYPANYKENLSNKFVSVPSEAADIFRKAFSSNPALSFVREVRLLYNNPMTYVVFRNEVVQYFNDNLGDIYGQCSTLYENIARDVLETPDGVYYCTDKPEGSALRRPRYSTARANPEYYEGEF